MPFFKLKHLLLSAALLSLSIAAAQEKEKETIGSEIVVVVKPYTPSVSDAFKVKAIPVLNDSIALQKKAITYKIFSIPVASTFTPAKGVAAKVEKAQAMVVYDNYATLGAGNYTTAMAEFYTNFEIDRGQNFGINLKHNSAQGGIEGVRLDNNYYDTSLSLDYSSRDRDLNYSLGADVLHKLFNWYGLPADATFSDAELNGINPTQNYFGASFNSRIDLQDSFFDQARAEISYFGDSYSTSEINAIVTPEFEFELAGEKVRTNLFLDYLNTSFNQTYLTQEVQGFSYLNLGLNPSILILRDDLTLNLGASVFYSLDSENSASNVYFYPNVNASYRVVGDYFIAYADLHGALEQNTYKGFVEENPFVSPTLFLMPTNKEYEGSLGIRGKLSDAVSYNLKGSYANAENQALFLSNTNQRAFGGETQNYQYGNSFNVVYDAISTLSFFGELNFEVSKALRLGINGQYFNYDTEVQPEAWNLPELKASLLADVSITPKLSVGANAFFVGEREAQASTFVVTAIDGSNTISTQHTLDAYFDVNLYLNYQLNNQLSLFVKGNNLLGNTYERWLNFPVYGIQGLAGATYKFDW